MKQALKKDLLLSKRTRVGRAPPPAGPSLLTLSLGKSPQAWHNLALYLVTVSRSMLHEDASGDYKCGRRGR